MKPFTPTRTLPHRFCHANHTYIAVLALSMIVGLCRFGVEVVVVLIAVLVLSAVSFSVLSRKPYLDVARDDRAVIRAEVRGTAPAVTVRRTWAVVAVCFDTFFSIWLTAIVYQMFTATSKAQVLGTHRGHAVSDTAQTVGMALIGGAIAWAYRAVHLRATAVQH